MPGLNERLASYTGEGRDQVSNYDKLAEMYGHSVAQRRAKEESWETEDQTSEVKLAVLQKMVAEQLEERAMADRSAMPVISKFEAYQIAKKANVETDERDAGIRMLSAMLKKHWAEDKSGDMVGETVMGLKKYFRANYPKSQVGEVFEIIADSGYSDLDVNSLARIAENIEDQESYEYEVRRAGLDTSSEKHKRARKVILSMVNSRQADNDVMVEKQTKPDFSPERQDVIGEEEEDEDKTKEARTAGTADLVSFLDGVVLLRDCVGSSWQGGTDSVWLDGSPVNVAIVHDGNGFNPGAALAFNQDGSVEACLEAAYEMLLKANTADLTPEDWESLEKDADRYGMDVMNLVAEKFNGEVFTVSPVEFKEVVDKSNNRELMKIEFDYERDTTEEPMEDELF